MSDIISLVNLAPLFDSQQTSSISPKKLLIRS